MAISPLSSPVVLDAIVSDEKLAELLALQAEYPELDFKETIDPTTTEGLVELAKDVGAMHVRGGYIVAGVDGHGIATGKLDGADTRVFDEANLGPKLRRYLPEPLELRTRVVARDGHTIVLIYVGRHPSGCAIFRADGQYKKGGKDVVRFRAGEAFWRDGTRSVRLSQQGLEEVIERRIAEAKAAWIEEQQEIRRRERAEREAAYESQRMATAPLGSVNLDLAPAELNAAALELVRAGDTIGLRHLLSDATVRARSAIDRDEIEAELGNVLDKLTCLAAAFLEYDQEEWLNRVVGTLAEIYSMPLGEHDARRFGFSTSIDPEEKAPRVWLQIIQRVFALGALAVRRRRWSAVRTLTVQLPERLDGYDKNWLRHALTMTSRAQHLEEQKNGQTVKISLLSLARAQAGRLECLRPDGVAPDDDAILTGLAQFDLLSNVAAIDAADEVKGRTFYPNFARFRQARIQPAADRLLVDSEMRQTLFPRPDEDLAVALAAIAKTAQSEGFLYDGFDGWERTPVGEFVAKNLPGNTAPRSVP